MAQEGLLLSERQLQALKKQQASKGAHGELDPAHPGYLGYQDTYYVGTFKGLGYSSPTTCVLNYFLFCFILGFVIYL